MRALVTFLLLFALAPVIARANTLTITCTAPPQFTDGTAIPSSTAISYRLYDLASAKLLDTQNTCHFVRTGLAPGTYAQYVTASINGSESFPTGMVSGPAIPDGLLTAGPYSYEPTGTTTAPTMSAIGLVDPGLPCGPSVRLIGTVKFCQITHAQTDLIGWPVDKTLKNGLWAKAQ